MDQTKALEAVMEGQQSTGFNLGVAITKVRARMLLLEIITSNLQATPNEILVIFNRQIMALKIEDS